MTEPLTEEKNVEQGENPVEAKTGERAVSKALAWGVAVSMICAFAAANAVTPAILQSGGVRVEWVNAVLFGICIAQVNLIAVWAALAPGNIVVRISWSLLLGTWMWYALVLGIRACTARMYFQDAVLLGIVLLAGVVVLQIPLWIAKKIFRWRLAGWPADPGQTALEDRQFTIRDMLLATFLLSVALSPLRQVLPPRGDSTVGNLGEMLVGLGVIVLCNLVVTIPCIWWAFVSTAAAVRITIGWLFYCAFLTGVEILAFYILAILAGRSPTGDLPRIFLLYYVVNVSQCATVFGVLRIFRAIGFRLVRMPRPT